MVLSTATAAKTNMAARLATFLKDAWANEPVLVNSFTVGGLVIIMQMLSPHTKYSSMINKATPYKYPVPARDDGNMPHVPSHPQDSQGSSLNCEHLHPQGRGSPSLTAPNKNVKTEQKKMVLAITTH
ncbi:NADH dehydrogenase [ubiquinone] 1 alpha subcomplex subunit 3-like [Nycticebus coucang]|uniref:NADH dehydrogenase [ubiquinone] 1 alpha subcomplex subunit 3-like n=1 Tax=Nycticebus coucang TaxID=9470 RepID=UPI00234C92BF|nr:NADH dehydrogenase [ubiquinone] 1 alpha subcomplex subunit 3-like [Nycticebus coucang]